MINNSALGGHVYVGDFAILGGLSAIHQFVRIGKHAMIGGASGVENDVIPFGSVTGNRARLSGLNIVGLKRRGFSRDDIHSLRTAYRILFANEGTIAERIEDVAALFQDNAAVSEVIGFMRSSSAHRSLCQP
jgi:UDP-N-acetylglucosamine acyltransferase